MFEHVLFGFCYVLPCDSLYYSHDAFASIQEKVMSNHMGNGYVIMGDMNARFGKAARDLADMYELPGMDISYSVIDDDVGHMNDNAEFLSAICMNSKLVVLNNLKTPQRHFISGKPFRKRDTWVVTLEVGLNYIQYFLCSIGSGSAHIHLTTLIILGVNVCVRVYVRLSAPVSSQK